MSDILHGISRRTRSTPAILAAALVACATESILLNSERIEKRFGSYGIEVLTSNNGLRRSNLFSVEDGVRVCRTYAIVRFVENPDSIIDGEHARVMSGDSLGAVFKSSGWEIHKETLYIGSIELAQDDSEVARLMRVDTDITVALHVYQLQLARDDRMFDYATIIEAHHPAYMTEAELREVFRFDGPGLLDADALHELRRLLAQRSPG